MQNDKYAKKSKIYSTTSDDDCMRYLHEDCKTLFDVLYRGQATSGKYWFVLLCFCSSTTPTHESFHRLSPGNGPCLGRLNKKSKSYDWISYSETLERIKNFGAGLLQLGLKEGSESRLGIYATNCVEYVVAEFACYNHTMTVVPLYDTLGPNVCTFIINQAGIECAVVDSEDRMNALISQANSLTTLKHIVVIQTILESYRSKAAGYGIKVHTIEEVEDLGRAHPAPFLKPRPRDLAVICYTSGTTGNPKGAMLSHENVVANVSSVLYQLVSDTR